MSGRTVQWGQADRGHGFGKSHLFWRDVETGLDEGHTAACGYNPLTLPYGEHPVTAVRFQPAADDAVRCERCLADTYLVGRIYYPLGEHPLDRKAGAS